MAYMSQDHKKEIGGRMERVTTNENLGKLKIHNGSAYEGRIGFDKDDNTVVKWYKITGHKAGTIITLYKEGNRVIFGKEVCDEN